MQRGLVHVEETDYHHGLLQEAIEHARGANADLVLLTLMPDTEFEAGAEMLSSVGKVEHASYDTSAVLEGAVEDVRSAVTDDIPHDLDVTIVARATDDPGDTLLDVAAEHDCDHVFVLGARRSPTGKALFGDAAQQVALNFEGYVTLATR